MGSPQARPSTAIEDYLKAVYVLAERGTSSIGTSQLAERLGVTNSSASGMVRKLSEQGLLEHPRYGAIALTAAGHELAVRVVRRHRLIEQLLVVDFGYGWDEVHDEAERLEHVVSDRLVEAIADRLGHPHVDPHGDPIPDRHGEVRQPATLRLPELSPGSSGTLARVDDVPDVLRYLSAERITLGDRLHLVGQDPFGGPFVVRLGRREVRLGPELAEALWLTRA